VKPRRTVGGRPTEAAATAFVLLVGVGVSLLSCTKRIDGDTSFKEASKGFQKELTKDQRKSAIEQLQTETAGKP
jgi:hypothetical protein